VNKTNKLQSKAVYNGHMFIIVCHTFMCRHVATSGRFPWYTSCGISKALHSGSLLMQIVLVLVHYTSILLDYSGSNHTGFLVLRFVVTVDCSCKIIRLRLGFLRW